MASAAHHKTASHGDDVMKQMYQLYKAGRLTDVTIRGRGGDVHCHAIVLISSSLYFDKLFASPLPHDKITTFDAVDVEILKHMIEYMYTGEIELTVANKKESKHLAQQMEITALTKCFPY